mgnify:CR=1 FL=1
MSTVIRSRGSVWTGDPVGIPPFSKRGAASQKQDQSNYFDQSRQRDKHSSEPTIRQTTNKQPALSAGKRMQTSHKYICFRLWLGDNVA